MGSLEVKLGEQWAGWAFSGVEAEFPGKGHLLGALRGFSEASNSRGEIISE